MGNTNSTEGNSLVASYQQRSRNSSSTSIQPVVSSSNKTSQPFQLSITEPTTEPDMAEQNTTDNVIENQDEVSQPAPPPTKAVPVSTGKSGWVSSTGAASPWYGSLGSSASSHHRASISGPYYRTRGMSVTRDNENDEDLSNIIANTPTNASSINPPTTLQPHLFTAQNQGVPTIITWTQGGNNVYVTGTFNGWKQKIKLVKSTHDFSAVLDLPPGTHRLKFIVDDEWKCSNDMETATDPDGNLVNYLQVMDESDEESEADEFDSDSKKYSNIIPPELLQLSANMEEEKKSEWEKKQPQPPTLPPHLEKVLLNSSTVSEEDNSVLVEPNHVTLNHLYACSIKDNVMALATTSRYRKKYVTTMYYRPVFPKT
ncbi:hypothetical protein MFLAVUS_005678 [Mucor flavus]|uniref:Association with the SNF1 complex (ASC) domain-containing protein n=1 Tax=Mucor flavus TaxID=439312 RepID=A0ABP9YZE2_9FUNG